jgi:transposase-like protein
MAKRRKHVEVRRWRVECPRCDRQCPAAVERFSRKAILHFECHGCGLSVTVELKGRDAKDFLQP